MSINIKLLYTNPCCESHVINECINFGYLQVNQRQKTLENKNNRSVEYYNINKNNIL